MSNRRKGHYAERELQYLEEAVRRRAPEVVLEIGVYLGRSTKAIADALPDRGTVIAVDPWRDADGFHRKVAGMASEHNRANPDRSIVVCRSMSHDAAKAWVDPRIDFVHIDGDHRSLGVYRDIRDWLPHLSKDGFFIGHDWPVEGVRFGVCAALEDGLLREVGLSDVQRCGTSALWWGIPSACSSEKGMTPIPPTPSYSLLT